MKGDSEAGSKALEPLFPFEESWPNPRGEALQSTAELTYSDCYPTSQHFYPSSSSYYSPSSSYYPASSSAYSNATRPSLYWKTTYLFAYLEQMGRLVHPTPENKKQWLLSSKTIHPGVLVMNAHLYLGEYASIIETTEGYKIQASRFFTPVSCYR